MDCKYREPVADRQPALSFQPPSHFLFHLLPDVLQAFTASSRAAIFTLSVPDARFTCQALAELDLAVPLVKPPIRNGTPARFANRDAQPMDLGRTHYAGSLWFFFGFCLFLFRPLPSYRPGLISMSPRLAFPSPPLWEAFASFEGSPKTETISASI